MRKICEKNYLKFSDRYENKFSEASLAERLLEYIP